MRKVFLFDLITLDGYFEGTNQDISWHNVDEEFQQFAIEQLSGISTILFGRVTYQMMASFWPTELAKDDPETAQFMNSAEKVVFSHTLDHVDWQNSKLVKTDVVEEIKRLKNLEGKSIAIFGSSDLAASIAESGVIDEYRLLVNPVFLGKGKTLITGIQKPINLELTNTRVFKNGNVLLTYEPK